MLVKVEVRGNNRQGQRLCCAIGIDNGTNLNTGRRSQVAASLQLINDTTALKSEEPCHRMLLINGFIHYIFPRLLLYMLSVS